MPLETLEQWLREQPAQEAVLSAVLQEERLYAVDGGVFKAKQEEDGRWTLWKSNDGKGGYDAGTRNGFEIGEFGGLYDRVWDYRSEEALVVTGLPRYTVSDLVPVTKEEAKEVDSAMTVSAWADQLPEMYDTIQDEIERGDAKRRRE